MSSLSFWLGLSKPADGDTAWGGELRNFMETVDKIANPGNLRIVGEQYTEANLYPYGIPSNRILCSTIQEAVDEIEDGGNDTVNTILVMPGQYTEELVITQSMNIIGLPGPLSQVLGTTRILGDGSAPPITVNPAAGETVQVTVNNIRLGQAGATFGNATIPWPYWGNITDQGSGNYGAFRNRLHFHNCAFRLDSLSGTDVFTRGLRAQGKADLILTGCQMRAPEDSDMTHPIEIDGNIATAQLAQLLMKQTDIWQVGSAGDTISMDNGSSGTVLRCSFVRDLARTVSFGGAGSNVCAGLNSTGDAEAHGNLFGIQGTFPY